MNKQAEFARDQALKVRLALAKAENKPFRMEGEHARKLKTLDRERILAEVRQVYGS